jgi:hypothetical protein
MGRLTWIAVVVLVAGCGLFKDGVRTIIDIARDACELYVDKHEGLTALTPEDFCELRDNLDPFVRGLTSMQETAGAELEAVE